MTAIGRIVNLLQGHILAIVAGIDRDVVVRFKELIGNDVIETVNKTWEESLSNAIQRALTTDNLAREFSVMAWEFWASLLPLHVAIAAKLHDSGDIDRVMAYEEELAKTIAKMLKSSGYTKTDDLIYSLSTLVDSDIWTLTQISKFGLDNFINRLTTRAYNETLQLIKYTVYLTFAWLVSTVAVLGMVKEYRETNRDQLAALARQYAEEVQGLLDTLDIILDDETYEDLLTLGIVKNR